MKRLALCTLLVGCALAQPASAHMVWLERTGPTVQLFYGEPENDRREKTGAALDTIASRKLVGADAPVTRQPDHIAFGPLPAGDTRAVEAGLSPRDDRQRGGRTRTIFLAREGRTETRSALDLELVPTEARGSTFVLMLMGKPLPRTTVTLIGPPAWIKELRTDTEGRVTLPQPWSGRYVAEIQHVIAEPGGADAGAYDRTRYVSTLSFCTPEGIAWAPNR